MDLIWNVESGCLCYINIVVLKQLSISYCVVWCPVYAPSSGRATTEDTGSRPPAAAGLIRYAATTAHFAATCHRGDLILRYHTRNHSLSGFLRGQRSTALRAWFPLSTGWPGLCPATDAATSACSAASSSPSPCPWTTATPTSTHTSSPTSGRMGTNLLF